MLTIFAVSDSIGETANQVAIAAASQFSNDVVVERIPYIKTLEDIEDVISAVKECEGEAIIVSTIITVNVREYLTQKGIENNISVINVLGPILNVASSKLNRLPDNNPGAMWETDEDYFKRIEAMEFAMQYDDSKDYRGLKNADVVLIGLSRTSKTPLCMYLANKGIKAINIPLVPEVGVPKELYEIDKKKVCAHPSGQSRTAREGRTRACQNARCRFARPRAMRGRFQSPQALFEASDQDLGRAP